MNNEKEREEHKQVTQPVAEQPQEEFISPENVPSKDESEVREKRGPAERKSPER